jgi:hypothetical protein
MGRIRWDDLPDDDEAPAETFMQLGPATVRPSEELVPLLERMREAKVTTILVATAEGRYVGAVNRDDGEAFIRERQAVRASRTPCSEGSSVCPRVRPHAKMRRSTGEEATCPTVNHVKALQPGSSSRAS